MSVANAEGAEFWTDVTSNWLEVEADIEDVSGLPGTAAMDRLELRPGERVLDVGCGTGRTTLALAERVRPGGRAVGTDIANGMLERARQHAAEAGTENADFVHADAQVHDFGEAAFDAAFSRFGVMFFSDPVAAFANVHRSLRPGGRLAFVCWQDVTQNEWMLVPGAAAMGVVGAIPAMPGPDEPGPFALADPQRIRSILDSAGFSSVGVEPQNDAVVMEEARIPHVARINSKIGIVNELLRGADDATRARVIAAIDEAMRSRLEGGYVRASRGFNLVTARA